VRDCGSEGRKCQNQSSKTARRASVARGGIQGDEQETEGVAHDATRDAGRAESAENKQEKLCPCSAG